MGWFRDKGLGRRGVERAGSLPSPRSKKEHRGVKGCCDFKACSPSKLWSEEAKLSRTSQQNLDFELCLDPQSS